MWQDPGPRAAVRQTRAPKAASVDPAKGAALVRRPWRNPLLFPGNLRPNGPKVRLQSRTYRWPNSMLIYSRKINSENSWPVGPNHIRRRRNRISVAAAVPGLRPSLSELLGLRPELFPAPLQLRGTKSPPQNLPNKATNSTDFAHASHTLPDVSGNNAQPLRARSRARQHSLSPNPKCKPQSSLSQPANAASQTSPR